MESNRGKAIVAAVLLLAGGLLGARALGLWGVGSSGKPAARPAAPRAAAPPAAPAARPPTPAAAAHGSATPQLVATADDDPRGAIRLEGQVIDGEQKPVGGARVAIDSNPPREAVTEGDGSFAFDGLIARDYRLEAQHEAGYAGPVQLRVTADTEPVILRLAPAGSVEVEVRGADDHQPIAGAKVELRSNLIWRGDTGADGKVVLAGVGAAWLLQLHVEAAGYAPAAQRVTTSGSPDRADRVQVALAHGAEVTGVVLSPDGKPVAGARVLADLVTEPFPIVDPRRDGVLTGRDGRFRMPAVSAGTWRFSATHPAHAPGSSAPAQLDGQHPRAVEIRLEAGAVLTGSVTGQDGAAVAGAQVDVVSRGSLAWRFRRRTFTGEDGHFKMSGLPRRAVDVVAAHAAASSAIATADLAAKQTVDVALTLDVAGDLGGTVVETDGQPIADAQVVIEPEWSGALGERDAWTVRGIPQAITDAGGAFRVGGLPAGSYRVRAARPGAGEDAAWLGAGLAAHPGQTDLKIVLPADGTLSGKVLYADGSAPELFTIEVGPAQPQAFAGKDGVFQVRAPGGTQEVVVKGPAFERTSVPAVAVEAGRDKDVGTITVKKGRSVSGRVLGPDGAPVAGAKVAGGTLLTGGGAELYIEDESIGSRDTTTGDDGRFLLTGFSEAAITLVAGKEGVGRAPSVRIPRGQGSAELELVLAATGGLDGVARRDGQPLAETVIIANPIGATSSNFFVITGADGSFAFDLLSPGDYTVFAMIGGGGPKPKDMFVRAVTVTAGARAKVEIEVSYGAANLALSVTADGKPVAAAQVFVAGADVAAASSTSEQLRDGSWIRALDHGQAIPLYLRMAMGGKARLEGLRAGPHTVCVAPIPIDPNDLLAMQHMREKADELPLKCVPYVVARSPAEQTLEVKVPVEWTRPPT